MLKNWPQTKWMLVFKVSQINIGHARENELGLGKEGIHLEGQMLERSVP